MEQSTIGEMKTPLYEKHLALGAKMVDFCGWKMPLYYQGIIHEHHAVRKQAGIFDISHMGRIHVEGKEAEPFLDYLSTNLITGKQTGSATYTVWCRENGMCIDDVIVYKESSEAFFIVANASNRNKDLSHLQEQSRYFEVQINDCFQDGILALQGPKAEWIASRLFPNAVEIKSMHFTSESFQGEKLILSRTGYTGAGGFEIYASGGVIKALWDAFLEQGRDAGLVPAGLGARDTLRLEMGYALYGHELSDGIAANESVARWTIKWNKESFLGKEALTALEHSLACRSEVGLLLVDKGVAREGYAVLKEGKKIGKITSGAFSPTLNCSIAIVLVDIVLSTGDIVDISIRDHSVRAEVVKLPFIKH